MTGETYALNKARQGREMREREREKIKGARVGGESAVEPARERSIRETFWLRVTVARARFTDEGASASS